MNNTHTYCNAQRPDARQGTVTTNTDNKLINRLDIIASFNPHLTDINPQSPLSVGKGGSAILPTLLVCRLYMRNTQPKLHSAQWLNGAGILRKLITKKASIL